MSSHQSFRWFKVALKFAVVVMLVWGVHRTVESAMADLRRHEWSFADLRWGWLVVSGVLYLSSILPCAFFWRRVLQTLGQSPGLSDTVRAYFIGHLGKYVPGKALVVILRAGLIRSDRVSTPVATVSIFFETLTMMAIGSMVGGAMLAVSFRHQHWLMFVALGMMCVAGLPTWPPIFGWLVRFFGRDRVAPDAIDRLAHLDFRRLAPGWAGIAVGWLVGGLSLWAAVRAGGGGEPGLPALDEFAVCTAAMTLSIVAGFLSLIPGGAVVREVVILEMLAPFYGEAGALISAVLFRLMSLVAELLISAILYIAGRSAATAPPP
jgi:uncharacterized membrane protein YbhN (UPF0104 family)